MPIWLIVLAISVTLEILAYVIMPKPKQPKPASVSDEQNPTADADKAWPVIFGEITLQSPNVLWYGDKSTRTYNVSS